MSLVLFYRVFANYIFLDYFSTDVLIERCVLSAIMISAGLLFNQARIVAIVIAALPMILLLCIYIFDLESFNRKIIGFMGAVVLLILFGLYYEVQSIKLRKELEAALLENNLVDY